RCKDSVVKNEMTIHGLWPNYEQGYPGCCNVSATIPNRPFNAAKFAKDQAPLLKEMSEKWIEPTVDSSYDSLCEIYNHEFQKHGLCYKTFEEDYDKAAAFYFRSTLNVAKLVDAATAKLNEFAASKAASTTLKDVEALYSKKVQVLCSAVDGQNQLSAVRTCWNKPTDISLETVFEQRDCSPATKMGAFVPCPADAPLTLLAYKSPTTGAPTPKPSNGTIEVPSASPAPSSTNNGTVVPTHTPSNNDTAAPKPTSTKTVAPAPTASKNGSTKAPTKAPTPTSSKNGSTKAPTTAPTQLPTGKPGNPTQNPAQQQQQQQTKPSTPGQQQQQTKPSMPGQQQQQQQTPSTPAKPAQGSSTPSASAAQNGSPAQQQQQQQQQKATPAPTKNAC
ncbi:TPA: hypothetical protein N0F65_007378, partial [Lagenidium giganteum]